jgi:hypothetical protein
VDVVGAAREKGRDRHLAPQSEPSLSPPLPGGACLLRSDGRVSDRWDIVGIRDEDGVILLCVDLHFIM